MKAGELKKILAGVPDDYDLIFVHNTPDTSRHYSVEGVKVFENYMHTNRGVVGLIRTERL